MNVCIKIFVFRVSIYSNNSLIIDSSGVKKGVMDILSAIAPELPLLLLVYRRIKK